MRRDDLGRVVLWMGGALLAFTVSALSVRNLAPTLAVPEMMALRSAIGVALLGAVGLALPRLRPSFRLRRPVLQALRNVPHWLGQLGWSWGLTRLPLATVFALEFTAPLWLAGLAVIFLGERLTLPRVGALLLGLTGVLVILRPGSAPFSAASLAVLGAAFAFAATAVTTKLLTRTETTFSILFWMNAMQLPLNLAGSGADFPWRIESGQVGGILGLGLSGVASHLCLTQAYRYGDATVVIPLDFLRIPLIAAVGFLLYGEALDPLVFAGAAIIVAGILWNLRAETRRRDAPA